MARYWDDPLDLEVKVKVRLVLGDEQRRKLETLLAKSQSFHLPEEWRDALEGLLLAFEDPGGTEAPEIAVMTVDGNGDTTGAKRELDTLFESGPWDRLRTDQDPQ